MSSILPIVVTEMELLGHPLRELGYEMIGSLNFGGWSLKGKGLGLILEWSWLGQSWVTPVSPLGNAMVGASFPVANDDTKAPHHAPHQCWPLAWRIRTEARVNRHRCAGKTTAHSMWEPILISIPPLASLWLSSLDGGIGSRLSSFMVDSSEQEQWGILPVNESLDLAFFFQDSHAQSLSLVWLFETSWTLAHQAPLSMGILQAKILDGVPFPQDLPDPVIWTHISCVSCIGRWVLYHWATREATFSGLRTSYSF